MIKTVKVSEKGQIALPVDVRENLGIEQGDELILIQSGNKLLLEKSSDIQKSLEDGFKDILTYNDVSLKSVWDNKSDNIWNSYIKRKKLKVNKG